MRIITLNAWAGRALYPLMKFIERYASTTDVFCFQEVYNATQEEVDRCHPDEYVCGDLFQRIERLIGGPGPDRFAGEFAARPENPTRMSQALFYRNCLPAIALSQELIHQPRHPVEDGSAVISGRVLQCLMLDTEAGPLSVLNYHGLWGGGEKTDTPERLEQSRRLRQFMDDLPGPYVLCGDLNLVPGTESLDMLEEGNHNLVVEHGIRSTRTPLYRHYRDSLFPHMADYAITSMGLAVREFRVLPDLASDHAALLIDID